jgi:hypothetical protein
MDPKAGHKSTEFYVGIGITVLCLLGIVTGDICEKYWLLYGAARPGLKAVSAIVNAWRGNGAPAP